MNITVIIPAFNEAQTIKEVLQKVLSQKVSQVILVDDGSTDQTTTLLPKNSKITLIKHKTNQGKGAAIRSGLKKAKGEIIIIQDADLEYDPKDYKKLISPLKKEFEFVFGTRWHNPRGYLLAQIGNLYLNKLINILFKTNYKDPYTGSKAGTKKAWQALNLTSSGFEIEAEICCKIAFKKIKYKEIPISYKPRSFSEGKKIGLKDLLVGTKEILKWRMN